MCSLHVKRIGSSSLELMIKSLTNNSNEQFNCLFSSFHFGFRLHNNQNQPNQDQTPVRRKQHIIKNTLLTMQAERNVDDPLLREALGVGELGTLELGGSW